MKISNEGLIKQNLSTIYSEALSVENYPEFATGYIHSRVIDYHQCHAQIERQAKINGGAVSWKTEILQTTDDRYFKSILFRQIDGPLRGMEVRWELAAQSDQQTSLKIIHQLENDANPKSGEIIKFFEEQLPKIADQFILDFTEWCEASHEHAVLDSRIKSFLAYALKNIEQQHVVYADVHQGPFMKNTFGTLDFKALLKNTPRAYLFNVLFRLGFHISKTIQKFIAQYGETYPVYGLLAQTVTYQDLIGEFIKFVKATRVTVGVSDNNLCTLEIHTGTGNASSQYLIPALNQGAWVITDRELNNFKHIRRALEVNQINFASIYRSIGSSSTVYLGGVDLAHLPESVQGFEIFDELIINMGAYFGNQSQTFGAFKKMNRLLKKNGLIYLCGYSDPHVQKQALREFLKSNFTQGRMKRTFQSRKVILTLLFALYVKLTTRQWNHDIQTRSLYLLNEERLKVICDQAGFALMGSIDLTQNLNFGNSLSRIKAYAIKKIQ